MKRLSVGERWLTAARSRLRVELSGLAFAVKNGHHPEDYASDLWGHGARGWMGAPDPDPLIYLRKEARAMSVLYPWIKASPHRVGRQGAELAICDGCLAGWGQDRWALSRSLGLSPDHVCRYCQEAFRVWGQQLNLNVTLTPQEDGSCLLRAARPAAVISNS